MGTEMSINGQIAPRGRTTIIRVPVLTDLDGNEIALTIHAVVGAKPGPTLAMHTATHGSEWETVEITRGVVEGLASSSALTHYESMMRGVIDLRDALYFTLVIIAFLVLNVFAIDWKKSD